MENNKENLVPFQRKRKNFYSKILNSNPPLISEAKIESKENIQGVQSKRSKFIRKCGKLPTRRPLMALEYKLNNYSKGAPWKPESPEIIYFVNQKLKFLNYSVNPESKILDFSQLKTEIPSEKLPQNFDILSTASEIMEGKKELRNSLLDAIEEITGK